MIPDGYPEVLADLAALVADCLATDLPRSHADALAFRITERIRHTLGGQAVYLPRGVVFEAAQRDRRLYHDFTGNNYAELCDRYGLGLQQVYECIHRERARRRQR